MEQSIESFMKTILNNDELVEIVKAKCKEHYIIKLSTFLEFSEKELKEDLKLPIGIVKLIVPHLKIKANLN